MICGTFYQDIWRIELEKRHNHKRLKRIMANILTLSRILCGILILFFPAFSGWYYLFYLLGGFTDAIDGTVARKRGTATPFGAKLDTVADIVFFAAVIIKIICNVKVPLWLLVWIIFIAIIKTVNVLVGFLKYHRFVAVHSVLNKLTGIILFILPIFIGVSFAWKAKAAVLIAACIIATIAAAQEFILVYKGENVD